MKLNMPETDEILAKTLASMVLTAAHIGHENQNGKLTNEQVGWLLSTFRVEFQKAVEAKFGKDILKN